jgi:anti-anti-sigma factor
MTIDSFSRMIHLHRAGGMRAYDLKKLPWGYMNLGIEIRKISVGFTMQLKGEVDISTFGVLRNSLDEVVRRGDMKALLINLSEVDYIDSTGIWVLTEANKKCVKLGIKFRLINVSPPVQKIFGLLLLEKVFEIFPNESKACEGL